MQIDHGYGGYEGYHHPAVTPINPTFPHTKQDEYKEGRGHDPGSPCQYNFDLRFG
jgi:hypothetical protein